MTPNDGIAPTIAVLLACLATAGHAGEWTTVNHIASTIAIETETSDGADARLEVQCGPEREVRVLHEALDAVPAETDKNPRYDGTVAVSGGWGLDLRRPEHRGARTRWRRCAGTPGCLRVRDTDWTITKLKKSWTWYLRARPQRRPALDMRVDLAGSAKAIDAACGEGVRPKG